MSPILFKERQQNPSLNNINLQCNIQLKNASLTKKQKNVTLNLENSQYKYIQKLQR